MIGVDTTSLAEGGVGTEVRADAAVASEEWNEVFCVSIAGTVFSIDNADEIESEGTATAVNSGVVSSANDVASRTACVLDTAREEGEAGTIDVTSGVFGAADAEGSDEVACADRLNGTAGGSSCANVGDGRSSDETNCADAKVSGRVSGVDLRGCARVADARGGACGAKISTRRSLNSKLCIAEPLKVIKI